MMNLQNTKTIPVANPLRSMPRWSKQLLCQFGWVFCLFLWTPFGFSQVELGADRFLTLHAEVFEGKTVGIIGNHTSLNSKGVHVADLLRPFATQLVLFGPEHGFQGNAAAGEVVGSQAKGKETVYSLYGDFRTPTTAMLKGVDVLVYDIQDVGVKFYTYISTLYLSLYAARRENIPLYVLDRPNPIGADRVEGPVTHPIFSSFVGPMPLPLRYGMTIGELAVMMNEEPLLGFAPRADLHVVKITNYRRDMAFDQTGLLWTAPSPNLPTLDSARIYPGMCLLEGTNLSEGRGTELPFLTIGAPYVDAKKWLESLPIKLLDGVKAEVISFTPRSIPEKAVNPKHENKPCQGLRFTITNPAHVRSLDLAVALLCSAQRLFPKDFRVTKTMDRLWGNEDLRFMIQEKWDYTKIMNTVRADEEAFLQVRKKYLLYPLEGS